ncbi:MAG: DNA polymerase ligase N-terminal domain-containing protein [Planctomycetaceae bacterium]
MSRFVLLTHDHPFVHWDFLMESGETARTWRLLESPARWLTDPAIELIAESLAAHRLMYLDYEGLVSRERGRVARWDHGQAKWLNDGETSVRLQLNGERLVGELTLNCEASRPFWSARFSPSVVG